MESCQVNAYDIVHTGNAEYRDHVGLRRDVYITSSECVRVARMECDGHDDHERVRQESLETLEVSID